jgi:uncharacterized membrane protein YhaH (DUF805 family)
MPKEMNVHWYLGCWKKFAVFEGRARRKEYWMFFLVNLLVSLGLMSIDNVSGLTKATNGAVNPLETLYAFAVFLPALSVTIRRLHDTDRSGWWVLIAFVPIIGAIVLLILMAIAGDDRENRYGPTPKV